MTPRCEQCGVTPVDKPGDICDYCILEAEARKEDLKMEWESDDDDDGT